MEHIPATHFDTRLTDQTNCFFPSHVFPCEVFLAMNLLDPVSSCPVLRRSFSLHSPCSSLIDGLSCDWQSLNSSPQNLPPFDYTHLSLLIFFSVSFSDRARRGGRAPHRSAYRLPPPCPLNPVFSLPLPAPALSPQSSFPPILSVVVVLSFPSPRVFYVGGTVEWPVFFRPLPYSPLCCRSF